MTGRETEIGQAIAARIRALPDVERLYPSHRRVLTLPLGGALLVTRQDAVNIEDRRGELHVEVDLAVAGGAPAKATARAVAGIVRDELDRRGAVRRRISIRIASIEH